MLNSKINKSVILAVAIFIAIFSYANAADKTKEIEIKTPTMQCSMCKNTIEKALEKLDGAIDSDANYKTGKTVVKYNPELTNPDEIRKSIAGAGYEADDIKADKKAYNKLPKCCKLPEDQ